MFALSEAPTAVRRTSRRAPSAACRVTSTGRPLAPTLTRPESCRSGPPQRVRLTRPQPSPGVYRRRRIAVALVAIIALSVVAAVLGGVAGRVVLERVVGLGVVVLWASCALALWRCNRSAVEVRRLVAPVSGVEPGASCLAPGSASVLSALPPA